MQASENNLQNLSENELLFRMRSLIRKLADSLGAHETAEICSRAVRARTTAEWI